jgi:hypothetical protein
MSAVPVERTSWSLIKAALQRWRDWTRRSSALELKCCAEDEVERMAKDIGMSAFELRRIAALGPGSADLLLRRMAALDLDRKEVSRTEPRTSKIFSEFALCATVTASASGTLPAIPQIRRGRTTAPTPRPSWH